MIFLALLCILLLPIATQAQTPAEKEDLLNRGSIGNKRPLYAGSQYSLRISLGDGNRTHDATVETEDGTTPTKRHYRLNVAAFELDKMLQLNLVAPSVERIIDGKQASVTWWVDDTSMDELTRRTNKIEPPDPNRWNKQMQAVRVFDELISNAYRDSNPDSYLSRVWDNLMITRDWEIWLIDHTRTFQVSHQLKDPENLVRCDRALLGALRALSKDAMRQRLGSYLSLEQLDALEARRELIVKHFDQQIAMKGEDAVLYDLPRNH